MADLKITNKGYIPVTTITDEFIEQYMPTANGDYVKIYLYLLYCVKSNQPISVSRIADIFQYTENDVKRALNYWESKGLLALERPEEHIIPQVEEYEAPAKQGYSAAETRAFKDQGEIKQLLFVCEKYIGKQLTRTDIETLLYFYDKLGFSTDLIEYLVEYSVSKNKRSLRYMEAVALEWHKRGIQTVEAAKQDSKPYSKECYQVLKALGVNNHDPLPAEIAFVNRWINEYGFTMDIILKACERTIMQIHNPKFEYVDGILKSWKNAGVHHVSDIDQVTADYKSRTQNSQQEKQEKAFTTKFHNFEQHSYDFQELEKKLFIN